MTCRYTYDGNGNILTVSDGTNTTSYAYDSAGQLLRENNQAGGFTHVWTYSASGNILSRTEYAYTTGSLENETPTDTVTYTFLHNNCMHFVRDALLKGDFNDKTEKSALLRFHDNIPGNLYMTLSYAQWLSDVEDTIKDGWKFVKGLFSK